MLLIDTEVKSSGIHGLGCFTRERIRKGDVVWRFDSRIDLLIPENELKNYPEPIQKFFRMYCYAEFQEGVKYMVLCADNSRHMNHSDTPNLGEAGEKNELNIALRDIEPGEELTVDYRLFDADSSVKFNH